jgi:alkanesulfonate monooxygenase SsuD/methylene tetrahydromethanopterin reductase-like flavin-dependent oxidoreductase (luciferase family)
MLSVFQAGLGQDLSDLEVYKKQLAICDLVEPLGFDSIWAAEHHFTDYTMCPSVTELLSYMAGRTERIGLGTAVIILPWCKDPGRVAVEVSMLDNLSDGRALMGFGRGIGRVEYDGFGIPMEESRDRFDEAAEIIIEGLETGFIEYDGKHFQQQRRELRPRPFKSFKDRLYMACQSPDSADVVADLGATMMVFAISPWVTRAKDIDRYRARYRKTHGEEPQPIVANIFCVCDEDEARGNEMAEKYMHDYWISALDHYEMDGTHFGGKGVYDYYAKSAEIMRDRGRESVSNLFTNNQVHGTPQQILDQIYNIREMAGPMNLNASFSYGGMPFDYAERSMRLFAEKVLPELHSWSCEPDEKKVSA